VFDLFHEFELLLGVNISYTADVDHFPDHTLIEVANELNSSLLIFVDG
jgi:hypothetical protein